MKKRILSVLLCGSLLFGIVFANAVSVEFTEENNSIETYSDSKATNEIIVTENIPHIHTGNSTSGGGCYTVPVYHMHTSACYSTITCGGPVVYKHTMSYCDTCKCGISRSSAYGDFYTCDLHGCWFEKPNSTYPSGCWHCYCPYYYQCVSCGKNLGTAYTTKCNNTIKTLICGKSTSTVESWKLNCTNEECFKLILKKTIDDNGYIISPEMSNLNGNTEIKSITWNTGDINDCTINNNGTYTLIIKYIENGIERTYQKELNITDAYVDYVVNHYQMNLDGTTYNLIESETNNTLIGDIVHPETKTYIGFTSPEKQEKQITAETNTINYYYTRNKYPVTYIDQTTNGTELSRSIIQMFYDSKVRGSDIGGSVNDNAYYNQYKYVSDTSTTVATDGATVYRIFEFCKTKKNSHIDWSDNNDTDGLRPEKYTLKLKQNGTIINEIELPSDQTDYTFNNLPKYDTDGNSYQYDVEPIVSDRYKVSVDENGNFIFEYEQPASFSVVIPKQIILDGSTGTADYDITVNDTFYYNDTLTVKPDENFILTDRSKISFMTGIVSQIKTGFTKEDDVSSGSTASGSISVNRRYFSGLWKGTFNFDIKFVMQN